MHSRFTVRKTFTKQKRIFFLLQQAKKLFLRNLEDSQHTQCEVYSLECDLQPAKNPIYC